MFANDKLQLVCTITITTATGDGIYWTSPLDGSYPDDRRPNKTRSSQAKLSDMVAHDRYKFGHWAAEMLWN